MCVSKKYRDTSSNNSTIHEFSDDSLYLPITYHIIYRLPMLFPKLALTFLFPILPPKIQLMRQM